MSSPAAAPDVAIDAGQLSPDAVAAVLALTRDALASDVSAALSEQAILRLRHDAAGTTHVVARRGEEIVGYLQLADQDDVVTAELVVAPAHRRRGVGTALASWAVDQVDGRRPLQAWAHGNTDAAAALARRAGFVPHRVLFQMRRSAAEPLPDVEPPAGVRIRTFRPGEDDERWVEVNARAFAEHPEQGRLTVGDLHERMAEEWFDAAGFFLAERVDTGRVVGFHWTKVHPGVGDEPTGSGSLGEVYVVGVDPSEQGTGLGIALTVTGLRHLVAAGVPTLMLYADESNAGAVRMYQRLGFTVASTDVNYERARAAG